MVCPWLFRICNSITHLHHRRPQLFVESDSRSDCAVDATLKQYGNSDCCASGFMRHAPSWSDESGRQRSRHFSAPRGSGARYGELVGASAQFAINPDTAHQPCEEVERYALLGEDRSDQVGSFVFRWTSFFLFCRVATVATLSLLHIKVNT
jgi:hypothetical protein